MCNITCEVIQNILKTLKAHYFEMLFHPFFSQLLSLFQVIFSSHTSFYLFIKYFFNILCFLFQNVHYSKFTMLFFPVTL